MSQGSTKNLSLQSLVRTFTLPKTGERITSDATQNTYTIGEFIGDGSFGFVFDCQDVWGNALAVKVLKPRDVSYDQIRNEAIAEHQKGLRFRHPNIAYVFDAFEYRDTFYIVFERCHTSINDLIKIPDFRGDLWLKPIAKCVLQAVHFMHVNGFAHRDIHGGNVLTRWLTSEMGEPTEFKAVTFKVADLGISKLVGEMTNQNTVLADWIRAPESMDPVEFGPMDHRMDLYHCGLLLLQVLLGKPLAFTREEILAGLPRDVALNLQWPYGPAINKALRRHVEFRTNSAIEFWHDLNGSK